MNEYLNSLQAKDPIHWQADIHLQYSGVKHVTPPPPQQETHTAFSPGKQTDFTAIQCRRGRVHYPGGVGRQAGRLARRQAGRQADRHDGRFSSPGATSDPQVQPFPTSGFPGHSFKDLLRPLHLRQAYVTICARWNYVTFENKSHVKCHHILV